MLVSGAGDGGLVDLVRATRRTNDSDSIFRHNQAVRWLAIDPRFSRLGTEMEEIDREAQNTVFRTNKVTNLYQDYLRLDVPESLLHRLRELKRSDTSVVFNYRDPE